MSSKKSQTPPLTSGLCWSADPQNGSKSEPLRDSRLVTWTQLELQTGDECPGSNPSVLEECAWEGCQANQQFPHPGNFVSKGWIMSTYTHSAELLLDLDRLLERLQERLSSGPVCLAAFFLSAGRGPRLLERVLERLHVDHCVCRVYLGYTVKQFRSPYLVVQNCWKA